MFHDFCRVLCVFIYRVFFRLKAFGVENIPEKGGFILASNHVSYLDPVAVGVACPRRLRYMARHDLFKIPLFGRLLRAVRAFPVKRYSQRDVSALKAAMKYIKNGEPVLLFPEGRRREINEHEPLPLLAGVSFIAQKAGAVVIPVFVAGTEKILPKGAKIMKSGKITVHFGEGIFTERKVSHQEFTERIMSKIKQLSAPLSS